MCFSVSVFEKSACNCKICDTEVKIFSILGMISYFALGILVMLGHLR